MNEFYHSQNYVRGGKYFDLISWVHFSYAKTYRKEMIHILQPSAFTRKSQIWSPKSVVNTN